MMTDQHSPSHSPRPVRKPGPYPDIDPYDYGYMPAGGKHQIYYEQSGNPDGVPVVVVHGGPGGGTSPNLRTYFDPQAYRIILFDQRGCGKSRPHASQDISLEDNTTWHLIEDMEALREKLGIDKWVVFGGSWGSTLALAYAIRHPERVAALILRGIFLLRRSEIEWFYQHGCSQLYPDLWERFLAPIPEAEHHDLIGAYYKRLHGDDYETKRQCALAWAGWEGDTLSIEGPLETASKFSEPEFAIAFARIESWYFHHGGFFEHDGWILDNVSALKGIPGWIIQGRYDVVTPMQTAWELHRAWPEARLNVVQKAGHSSSDTGIFEALVSAADEAAALLISA